jgi:hypothetical protein
LKVLEKWATQPPALEIISKQKETVCNDRNHPKPGRRIAPKRLDDLGLVPALEKIAVNIILKWA